MPDVLAQVDGRAAMHALDEEVSEAYGQDVGSDRPVTRIAYLGTTGPDMMEVRARVRTAIEELGGWRCVEPGDFPSSPNSAFDARRDVDAYIGIVGLQPPFRNPGQPAEEYAAARRRVMHCLMFILDPAPPDPSVPHRDRSWDAFRERLYADGSVERLSRDADWEARVVRALLRRHPLERSLPAKVGNIPFQRNRSYVDIGNCVPRIRQALSSGSTSRQTRLVLTGMMGIGKTQAALEYAHSFQDHYGAVWWIDAGNRTMFEEQMVALAASLSGRRLPVIADVTRRMEFVRSALEGSGAWLLIIDRASPPDTVGPYLPDRHAGHVLITSRFRDWEAADVLAMPLPSPSEASDLARALGLPDRPDASPPLERLGFLPLAIDRWIGILGETAAHSDDDPRWFGALADAKETPAYPCTLMQAAIDWFAPVRNGDWGAWRLLQLLSELAPAPINTHTLSHGLNDAFAEQGVTVAAALSALVSWSLVTVERDQVVLHPVTGMASRRIGQQRDDGIDSLRDALAFLQCAFPDSIPSPTVLAECDHLRPHVETMLRSAERLDRDVASNRAERALLAHLRLRFARYLRVRGETQQAYQCLGALQIPQIGGGDLNPGEVHNELGWLLLDMDNPDEARFQFQKAIHAFRKADAVDGIASGLTGFGAVLRNLGLPLKAQERLEEAVTLGQHHNHRSHALALRHLALTRLDNGDPSTALALLSDALSLDEEAEDRIAIAADLVALGRAQVQLGLLEQALDCFHRALAEARAFTPPNHPAVVGALFGMGLAFARRDDPAVASAHFRHALELAGEKAGEGAPKRAVILVHLALALRGAGEWVEAGSLILRAEELFKALPERASAEVEAARELLARLLADSVDGEEAGGTDGKPDRAFVPLPWTPAAPQPGEMFLRPAVFVLGRNSGGAPHNQLFDMAGKALEQIPAAPGGMGEQARYRLRALVFGADPAFLDLLAEAELAIFPLAPGDPDLVDLVLALAIRERVRRPTLVLLLAGFDLSSLPSSVQSTTLVFDPRHDAPADLSFALRQTLPSSPDRQPRSPEEWPWRADALLAAWDSAQPMAMFRIACRPIPGAGWGYAEGTLLTEPLLVSGNGAFRTHFPNAAPPVGLSGLWEQLRQSGYLTATALPAFVGRQNREVRRAVLHAGDAAPAVWPSEPFGVTVLAVRPAEDRSVLHDLLLLIAFNDPASWQPRLQVIAGLRHPVCAAFAEGVRNVLQNTAGMRVVDSADILGGPVAVTPGETWLGEGVLSGGQVSEMADVYVAVFTDGMPSRRFNPILRELRNRMLHGGDIRLIPLVIRPMTTAELPEYLQELLVLTADDNVDDAAQTIALAVAHLPDNRES